MQRTMKSLIAMSVLITTLAGFACAKSDVTRNAGYVLTGLRAAMPLVNQLIPAASAKLEQASAIAQKLNDAIAANQSTEAIGFLRDLIPAFESIIANDVDQLPIETRTKILAVLAIVNIGLSFLANYYLKSLPAAAATRDSRPDVIAAYAQKPVWGEAYKH